MKLVVEGRTVWVNYHHLYCFHAVVSEGGITRASQALGIGQSALSIQMKQFEENLGFQLFERSHRSIKPTERGMVVYSYAREIFRLGGEMMEALMDRPHASRIHVKVGALDTIPKHLVIELVESALGSGSCSMSVMEGKPAFLLEEQIGRAHV